MPKELESIQATERKQQRQRLWDQWQAYLDEIEQSLQQQVQDPDSSATIQKMMALCHHISGQLTRESSRDLTDFLREVQVKNLTNAYKPGWKQITPIAVQILGSLAAGAVGIAPSVMGYTGTQAQSFSAASSAIQGTVVTGASSVGQIMGTLQEGKRTKLANEVEADKRTLSALDQTRNQELQASRRRDEDESRIENQRHETMRMITSVN